jgi:hypothetical protein
MSRHKKIRKGCEHNRKLSVGQNHSRGVATSHLLVEKTDADVYCQDAAEGLREAKKLVGTNGGLLKEEMK